MSETRKPAAPGASDAVWDRLRRLTPARIGQGRVGTAQPLNAVLEFQSAHAAACDAVHARLDTAALEAALAPLPVLHVASAAPDRQTYLRRPDLGKVLAPSDADALAHSGPCDVAFIIADGLSATGVQHQAAPLVHACIKELGDLAIAPVVIAQQARVAIGDPIGQALGARMSVIVIGERPGLTVSDSLGLYLTYDPRPGRRDSERNCISNIHARGGLSHHEAACTLAWLIREGLRLGLTGVGLKDDQPQLPGPAGKPELPGT